MGIFGGIFGSSNSAEKERIRNEKKLDKKLEAVISISSYIANPVHSGKDEDHLLLHAKVCWPRYATAYAARGLYYSYPNFYLGPGDYRPQNMYQAMKHFNIAFELVTDPESKVVFNNENENTMFHNIEFLVWNASANRLSELGKYEEAIKAIGIILNMEDVKKDIDRVKELTERKEELINKMKG